MLYSAINGTVPPIIMQILWRTSQIPVISTPVNLDPRFGRSIPVHIKAQTGFPTLPDIIISTVQSTLRSFMVSIKDFSIRIGNQMADPFDTIIIERMAQRKVDIEFRREIAIR